MQPHLSPFSSWMYVLSRSMTTAFVLNTLPYLATSSHVRQVFGRHRPFPISCATRITKSYPGPGHARRKQDQSLPAARASRDKPSNISPPVRLSFIVCRWHSLLVGRLDLRVGRFIDRTLEEDRPKLSDNSAREKG